MRIIRPTLITDAMLITSNVPETDYAAYSGGVTYALGARVMVTASGVHKVYESLQAGNVGHYPPDDPVRAPVYWLEVGPTNRWGMFDDGVGTVTEHAEEIDVTIAPGLVDSIAFLNTSAQSIVLTMTDPVEGVVYSEEITMQVEGMVSDWYEYFFEEIVSRTEVVGFSLPPMPDAQLRIQIKQPGGTASCGVAVVGRSRWIGAAKWGLSFGIADYSRKERDTWGRTVIVERRFSDKGTVDLLLARRDVDVVKRALAGRRAVATVYVIVDDMGVGLIYGYYKDFTLSVPYSNVAYCSIEIEGLV